MKLVISGGGTGGHVYPALTVVEALCEPQPAQAQRPALAKDDVLWVGSRGGMEEALVQRAGLEYVGLAAGGLRGISPPTKIRNMARIVGSIGTAQDILRQFGTSAVLVTGGYACVSITLAARLLGVPVLVYLPDIVPGQAIRFLSRFATRIAVTSEESYHYFRREKVVVTGYPVRAATYNLEKAAARQSLGLEPDLLTLLVFGGSQGARSLNRALVGGLQQLLPVCQIIHVSGRLDEDWVAASAKGLPEDTRGRYHHYPYLHEMPQALVAADLAVARAGASTLGEFPAAQLPAVLVPYPYSGQHQDRNARFMERNGAVLVLPDAELEGKLVPTVLALLEDRATLAEMRESAKAMARPDAAQAIAELLWNLARRQTARREPAG